MKPSGLLGNLSVALMSQSVSILVSVSATLLMPKIMSVDAFGYWQLFTFYVGYVAIATLGLNDGVYLLNGGRSTGELDLHSINGQFRTGLALQTVLATLLAAAGLFLVEDSDRSFVIIATAVTLIIQNTTTYITFVFQAVNRTKLFSYSVAIAQVVFLVPLLILVANGATNFKHYVIANIAGRACALLFALWFGRTFVFTRGLGVKDDLRETWKSIRVGASLMLANVASMLILGVSRAVVDAHWGIEVFSLYSFAVVMVSLFMLLAGQVAMVLFPALRRVSTSNLAAFYTRARAALSLLLPQAFVAYYAVYFLLPLWLPNYAESLRFFALLLPLLLFDVKMSVVGTSYFKVMRGERTLLVLNLACLVTSAVAAISGAALNSVEMIAISSCCIVALRYIMANRILSRRLGVPPGNFDAADAAISSIFLLGHLLLPAAWSAALISCALIAFYWINRRETRALLIRVGKQLRRG